MSSFLPWTLSQVLRLERIEIGKRVWIDFHTSTTTTLPKNFSLPKSDTPVRTHYKLFLSEFPIPTAYVSNLSRVVLLSFTTPLRPVAAHLHSLPTWGCETYCRITLNNGRTCKVSQKIKKIKLLMWKGLQTHWNRISCQLKWLGCYFRSPLLAIVT